MKDTITYKAPRQPFTRTITGVSAAVAYVKSANPEQQLVTLMKRIENTWQIPGEEEISSLNEKYKDDIDSLIEGLKQDGEPGYFQAKTLLLNKHPHVLQYLATEQEEETDPRLTTGKNGKKVFRTTSMEDVDSFPDIEWLVSKLLQVASVSLLYGESGTGKSFIALAFAFSIAYGIPWLGRPVKKGKVLYIYAEGRLGLKPRMRALLKHHNLKPTQNLQFIAVPVHLLHDHDFLLNTITEQEEIYSLVVIDTYSNCTSGINQNDQAEVERVLATCHEITRESSAHVMLVHHTNKQKGFNGSQAFKNHVDTMIEASREDAHAPITLHCEKQRDDEEFSDFNVQLHVIGRDGALGHNTYTGEAITSCVVVASNAQTMADRTKETRDQEQEKMLTILALHKRLTVNKWIAECKAAGISKTAFYQHTPDLKEQKRIIYEPPVKNGLAGCYTMHTILGNG